LIPGKGDVDCLDSGGLNELDIAIGLGFCSPCKSDCSEFSFELDVLFDIFESVLKFSCCRVSSCQDLTYIILTLIMIKRKMLKQKKKTKR
jgi:hypothetical protein